MTPVQPNAQQLPTPGAIPAEFDPVHAPSLLANDPALFALLLGLSSASGAEFFKGVTRALTHALGVPFAVIAEYLPETDSARSIASWMNGSFGSGDVWPIAGTPCRNVLQGHFSLYPEKLRELFPSDAAIVELGAESYLGVPLQTPEGRVLGHAFVMDTKPMSREPRNLALFRILATLAAKELARQRLEEHLHTSEERFRDLFDEAPIAYVHERLDTSFIRANRAALRTLGLKPEEATTTFGRDLVADTPGNKERLREAFSSVGKGSETSGVVLEMRRKSDGKPAWIQWWSRPAPGGSYTRTMFIDITDKVLLEREQARLQAQNLYLRDEIRDTQNFGEIIGQSPALRRTLDALDRVAPTQSTVLIQGETGTGKELLARAIHERSPRASGPFVKVNCAALPAGLVESEFFGHERGAFTGAVQSRKGRFEVADGGTIFLDEVGEVSPDVQVKLLRVLQESEFERVGGSETIRVSVRVIAATNRDLAAEVQAGRFRADLYYRLSVFPIQVPSLRARTADIPLLAESFVRQISALVGKRFEAIDAGSMDRMLRYGWPGNIRELRNVIERAMILCDEGKLRITETDLGLASTGAPSHGQTLDEVEAGHIRAVLAQTGGVVAGESGAARILGVPPSTLRSRMAKLGITP